MRVFGDRRHEFASVSVPWEGVFMSRVYVPLVVDLMYEEEDKCYLHISHRSPV